MKRIALLMSGESRLLWLAAPSLNKYVIEPNNADIFLYLNKDSMIPRVDNEEEVIRKVFDKNYKIKSLIFTDGNYNKEVKGLIETNYVKIDNHYKKLGRDKWDKQLNHHNTDQYLKLKKCAESAVEYANKNNFKYDLMVRVRPNHGWLNKFDLLRPSLSDVLYANYSMHDVGYDDKINSVFWVEDTCFFGGQDIMHKLCSDFSDKMVDELEICDERYDLSCATEKLLGRVLQNSGIHFAPINGYFGYKGEGFIRPKLAKYFVDLTKSPNFYLVEKYYNSSEKHTVYFDRIGQENIDYDNTLYR